MNNKLRYAVIQPPLNRRIILFSLGWMLCVALNSQSDQNFCRDKLENKKFFEEKLSARLFVNTNLKDSMQFFNNWMKGDIILSTGDTVRDEYLRYNRLIDELLWLRSVDFKTGVIYKPGVIGFVLKENNIPVAEFRIVQFTHEIIADSTAKYLQVLAIGNVTLYAQRRAELLRNTNEIVRKDRYYLHKDNKLVMLIPTRTVLYSLFGKDKEQIKQIVRSHHLWIRKESHLIKAINLYNLQNP